MHASFFNSQSLSTEMFLQVYVAFELPNWIILLSWSCLLKFSSFYCVICGRQSLFHSCNLVQVIIAIVLTLIICSTNCLMMLVIHFGGGYRNLYRFFVNLNDYVFRAITWMIEYDCSTHLLRIPLKLSATCQLLQCCVFLAKLIHSYVLCYPCVKW